MRWNDAMATKQFDGLVKKINLEVNHLIPLFKLNSSYQTILQKKFDSLIMVARLCWGSYKQQKYGTKIRICCLSASLS